MKRKRVLVDKATWAACAKAADTIMEMNPTIKAAWLERACDMSKPDLLRGDTAWPLAFFTWMTAQTIGLTVGKVDKKAN